MIFCLVGLTFFFFRKLYMYKQNAKADRKPKMPSRHWKSSYCHPVSSFFFLFFLRWFHQQLLLFVIAVQSLSCVWLFATPGTAACQASLSFSISQSLFRLMSIELVKTSNQLILCCLLLLLPQSFPASWSFPTSHHFASGGQRIGASASASVLPMNIQGWFPLGWAGWISLQSRGTLTSLLQHHRLKASKFFSIQPSLRSNSHICTWPLEKPELGLYRPYFYLFIYLFIFGCMVSWLPPRLFSNRGGGGGRGHSLVVLGSLFTVAEPSF